jgi:hypothetical protein
MINLITGKITDGSNVKYQKIGKYDVCLDKQVEVSKGFLDSNFGVINRVFKEQQENENIFYRMTIKKELYKIVDISYENLVYLKNELFIYKNDFSDDLQIELQNDVNDQYLNCLFQQLKDGTYPCLESLFEKDFAFIKENSNASTTLNQNLIDNTDKFCSALNQAEDLDSLNFKIVSKNKLISETSRIKHSMPISKYGMYKSWLFKAKPLLYFDI